MNPPADFHLLVTGDIVLDSHLYGGVKLDANSPQEPGTVSIPHLGGAALSCKLLKATADASGVVWDAAKAKYDKECLEQGVTLKWPKGLATVRPAADYSTHLGIDPAPFKNAPPGSHCSYGVWTPYPVSKSSKPTDAQVWRVKTHFGYGSGHGSPPPCKPAASLPLNPGVILVDDGSIAFRNSACARAWPDFAATAQSHPFVILKMSASICRGDLWPHLLAQPSLPERLLVVVSAADLRCEDAQIRPNLSWEQCATDALIALDENPIVKQLLKAAHIVVNFQSAGALWLQPADSDGGRKATLIFDPRCLEGDFVRDFDGTVYGYQTCLAVSLTHRCATAILQGKNPSDHIPAGIISGLTARRALLRLGHGPVGSPAPGIPIADIASILAADQKGFAIQPVPDLATLRSPCPWSILATAESGPPVPLPPAATTPAPDSSLVGLAQVVARFGTCILHDIPAFSQGDLFTVDRVEIESFRILDRLIRDYEDARVQKKPLSIGVFGPPGAGKSFGVNALAKAILGKNVPILEFNLSQFKDPGELIGAFHRIRDKVLEGTTPVAFWDEFDSQGYRWLQYVLAPMQDGKFQEGQITHPIGKCIFIFAGGTADSLAEFGPSEPPSLTPADRRKLGGNEREDRLAEEKAWHEFKLLKGPDFISRLHGYLNVLGPNPGPTSPCPDRTWPIRRALFLRGKLDIKDEPAQTLDMDPGLLRALLSVPKYTHGSRSFEKILLTLKNSPHRGHFHRSALPPDPILDRETNADAFHKLMKQADAFKTTPDLEKIAAAIHQNYLKNAAAQGWSVKPELNKPYADLAPDYQSSNRAAAQRIPELLALIDFKVIPNPTPTDLAWQTLVREKIGLHRERLAQAEHLGWNAERFANGWTSAAVRNDALKHHNLLVDWSKLSEKEKDKDRENMDAIPTWLEIAGHMALPA